MKIFEKGFNYSQDGPGNRLVYHLQGCNFRCKWCSNPEGMGSFCSKTKEMSVDEMLLEIQNCRAMFFDGGGVTLTGGEATLQLEEVFALFTKCKEIGIDTAIETNGSHPGLPELFSVTDHLIMDIKHFDSAEHFRWTGNDAELTYKNLGIIASSGKNALIRIPLIKGVNLSPEGFLKLFGRLDCKNISFEFLPYHEYGKEKWTDKYEMTDGFISDEEYRSFRTKFENNGYRVVKT